MNCPKKKLRLRQSIPLMVNNSYTIIYPKKAKLGSMDNFVLPKNFPNSTSLIFTLKKWSYGLRICIT